MTLNFTEATAYRKKWMPNLFQEVLHNALVAEKICQVDTSDVKYIENPYHSAGSVTQQAIAGTYSVNTFSVTADTLTVSEEFVWSEQVYNFEQVAAITDVKGSRMKEAMAQMATSIDKYVVNALGTDATGTYSTPAGGFTTPSNINVIIGDLQGKFSGYDATMNGLYIVIESSDLTGFVQAGMTNGWSFADAWLNNGRLGSYGGFDIYVLRAGTFVTTTLGSKSVTMSGKRLAGVKGITTYCRPGAQMQWMEKEVSGKTGVELAMVAYCGFRVWAQKATLTIRITIV